MCSKKLLLRYIALSSKATCTAFLDINKTENVRPWILPKYGSLLETSSSRGNRRKVTQIQPDWCQTDKPQSAERTGPNATTSGEEVIHQDFKEQQYLIASGTERLGLVKAYAATGSINEQEDRANCQSIQIIFLLCQSQCNKSVIICIKNHFCPSKSHDFMISGPLDTALAQVFWHNSNTRDCEHVLSSYPKGV